MLKYLHEIVGHTPEGCTCTVDEQENLAGTSVIGHTLVAECSICQALREASLSANTAAQKITRIAEIKNIIVKLSVEKDKATSLGYSDLVSTKTTEIATLQDELEILEA